LSLRDTAPSMPLPLSGFVQVASSSSGLAKPQQASDWYSTSVFAPFYATCGVPPFKIAKTQSAPQSAA
jgi:hypothetical protein